MNRLLSFLLISLLVINSCKEKNMSLEELQQASWTELDNGIDYISIENGGAKTTDSTLFTLKGAIQESLPVVLTRDDLPLLMADSTLKRILSEKLPDSKRGYLRLNIVALLSTPALTAHIFLHDNYDTARLDKDLQFLKQIPGIVTARFLSKEEAKKKYFADGNEDWDKVLDQNPLSMEIEIEVSVEAIKRQGRENITNKIKDHIIGASEVSLPSPQLSQNGLYATYYIIEYRHIPAQR